MLRKYNLLENILIDIKEGVKDDINTDIIAKKHSLSISHLHRLFKLAFNQSIGFYIRSCKLTASINDLFNTKSNILDIAICYGYKYEQSYINAFKREFGITPGELRKKGKSECLFMCKI